MQTKIFKILTSLAVLSTLSNADICRPVSLKTYYVQSQMKGLARLMYQKAEHFGGAKATTTFIVDITTCKCMYGFSHLDAPQYKKFIAADSLLKGFQGSVKLMRQVKVNVQACTRELEVVYGGRREKL